MEQRDVLLQALYLADQDGNTEAVNEITAQLQSIDQNATTVELLPEEAKPVADNDQSTGEYILDRLKFSLARGGARVIPDVLFTDDFNPDEIENFDENKVAEIASLLGYQGRQPKDWLQKYLGVAAQAAVDPINWATRYGTAGHAMMNKSLDYLTKTAKPYAAGLIEWATGVAAETAGYFGSEVAADVWKGTEYEDTVVDHLSRVVTGIVFGSGPGVIRSISAGKQGLKEAGNAVSADAAKVNDLLANEQVKAVIDNAIQSQGQSFGDRLKAAEELQKQFPDLVLPLVDVVGDNAVLATEFRRLYSANPTFRQKYDDAVKQVQQQFDVYSQGAFPSPLKPGERLRDTILSETQKKSARTIAKGKEKLDNIEVAKAKLASKYDEAPLAKSVESASRGLADSAEKAAREHASGYYDLAFEYARNNGITVPPASVERLWTYSRAQRKADLFADFPSLYRKLNSIWKPVQETVEASPIIIPGMPKQADEVVTRFRPATVEDVDSLKRELNKAIRSTTDRTKQSALYDFKDELDRTLIDLEPTFAQMYKRADAEYYKGVGLPTSLDGYRSIDSAKFSTSTAEALTKPDQIRDYINFVGRDAGEEVVRDAFLLKARRSIIKPNGDIDPDKLRAFVARNNDALNEVPNVRAMFDNDVALADRISRAKSKIDSNYNSYAAAQSEGFFKAIKNKNIEDIASEVIRNPGKRKQYMNDIASLSERSRKIAETGLRQAMLDKAFKAPNSTVWDYIKKNREAFDDVFGAEYTDTLNNLARLRDILDTNAENMVATSISHRYDSAIKEAAGVSSEEILGTLRNQVMSPTRKLMHLVFKGYQVKNRAKADKALADVLLDTNGLEALNAETKKLLSVLGKDSKASRALKGKVASDFLKKFSATLGGYITIGAGRGGAGSMMNQDDLIFEGGMTPAPEEDDWLFAPEMNNASP